MEITSYLLGKKSSGGGGGGSSRDWSEIGYSEEPNTLEDGFDYAKQIYDTWDASITNRNQGFRGNSDLIVFPNVNFSNVTNASYCFEGNYRLTTIPKDILDYEKIVDCSHMFENCWGIQEIGNINVEGYKNLMFNNCKNLKKVGSIKITASNDASIFQDCNKLEEIYEIKAPGVTKMSKSVNNMFANCPNLSNKTLKIILLFLKGLSSQSYKTLGTFGLSQTQAELCTTFDEWTDLANAGWTTGY